MTNGAFHKPQPDVYTLMLLLALLAIIVATVFLYLETMDYPSPPYQGAPTVSVVREGPALVIVVPTAGTIDGRVSFGDGPIHA